MSVATAILLSWKRVENLARIVEQLKKSNRIGEIFVWNNNPDLTLDLPVDAVINSPRNFSCLARYCLVPLAANDVVWFQDDDVLVTPAQLETVFMHYERDPSRIYGCRGRNVVNGQYTWATIYGDCDIILGQAMLFHRNLYRHAFATLGALGPMTEDDIAFSLSCDRRHFAVNVEPIQDLGDDDEVALWKRPNHFEKRQECVALMLSARAARMAAV